MAKILVVHGAGMNMRGKAQLETFGPMTLEQYDKAIMGYAMDLKIMVETFHSNIEGEIINRLYAAHDGDVDAAVINPSGFMNNYPALTAAVTQVRFPSIEVHISNPAARGITSQVGAVCKGSIAGFGIYGYRLALEAALSLLKPKA